MYVSIPVAILPSCQYICIIVHENDYSWLVKIRNTSEAVLRPQYNPWPPHYPCPPVLGQYDGLGEYIYCRPGPHTALSLFLIHLRIDCSSLSALFNTNTFRIHLENPYPYRLKQQISYPF